MTRQAQSLQEFLPKILIICIQAPYNRHIDQSSYCEEFVNLIKSNGLTYVKDLFIKLRDIDSAYFVTRGKLDEIKKIVEEHGIDEIVLSEPLSTQQERNLADYLHCRVFDRTRLILDIFEKSAHSAEGKTQVAIARLHHMKSRLSGKGSSLSQQSGIVGVNAGPGETLKERETRHIENLILTLKRDLVRIHKTRETQRKQRLSSGYPLICLIGYTNAGKSTILNTLAKGNVLAEDRLFATLDTTTRELYLDGNKIGLLSDTVGFIQQLPHQLIEAFKSTLSELQHADLLLHVIDVSDKNWESHIEVVHDILEELNVEKEMLYVFNKVDKVANLEELAPLLKAYQPQVIISANSKTGCEPLHAFLASWNRKK